MGNHRWNWTALKAPACVMVAALALAFVAPALATAQSDEGPETRNYDESLDQAARLTFQRAREAFVNGDYEEALRLFRQAYELSPRPVLLYNIAATLDRLRRDAEAVDALQAYLEADPDAPERAEIEARIRVLQAGIAEREAEDAARDAERRQQEAALDAERERLAAEDARQQASAQDGSGRDGLHPGVFWATAGAALAVGGVAAWSGANASSSDDEYRRLAADAVARGATEADVEEVREAFDEVESAQFRTNLLIGIGGTLAVGAVVLVFLTDFGGGDDDPSAEARRIPDTLPQVAASPEGFVVGATHRF